MKEKTCCHCGVVIDGKKYKITADNEIVCLECANDYCYTCDECGLLILDCDVYGDDDHCLCRHCYEEYYVTCECCDRVMYEADAYSHDGRYYCEDCYNEKYARIHNYGYKPYPIFYGDGDRYFGVELEIDKGGHDRDNAYEILEIGNLKDECIYIKSDGSLIDGMEIVTHPMTLDYHKNDFFWEDVMHKSVQLGYRSHQTTTCGLHIHVNRNSLGKDYATQEESISRILYFVEHHWNEILKFSRRSEEAMNRWAARYGYESSPKKILDKAKSNYGRYSAVNLCNYDTVEFRMFRGTLKYNTLIATLQIVNHICDVAVFMSDKEIKSLSWSDFVSKIKEAELIQYLKERRLYINEAVAETEEI